MGKRHQKSSVLFARMARRSRRSTPAYGMGRMGPTQMANQWLNPFIFPLLSPTNQDTLYPGRAGVPCLGIATDSDYAGHVKSRLKALYHQLGIPFRCHTCGANLDGGQWIGHHFLEKIWVGDHQPPTSAWRWPEKMQYIESFTSHILVVESQNLMYQTRYPVPQALMHLFQYSHPHRYPLYVNSSGQIYPQRYIYPQCESCSRRQSHSL